MEKRLIQEVCLTGLFYERGLLDKSFVSMRKRSVLHLKNVCTHEKRPVKEACVFCIAPKEMYIREKRPVKEACLNEFL